MEEAYFIEISPAKLCTSAKKKINDLIRIYSSVKLKHQAFVTEQYEELKRIEEMVNDFFDNCSFINDDQHLESLTLLCRTLNEDPTIEQIRNDNNVTYISRMKEDQQYRLSKSPTLSVKSFQSNNMKKSPLCQSGQSPIKNSKTLEFNSMLDQIELSKHKFYQEEVKQIEKIKTQTSSKEKRLLFQSRFENSEMVEESKEMRSSSRTDLKLSREYKQEYRRVQQNLYEELKMEISVQSNQREVLQIDVFSLGDLMKLKEECMFFYNEFRFDEAILVLEKLKVKKDHSISQYPESVDEIEAYWNEHIEQDINIHSLKLEYKEMIDVIAKFDETEGFRLVRDDHKKKLKMYIKKEDGQRVITMKFEVESISIPTFNLLALINETDLYELWFPFCKKSFNFMQFGKAKKVAYTEFFMPFPLKNREGIMYGFGVNRMKTHGTILVLAKSLKLVQDPMIHQQVGELHNATRKDGLIELTVHYYGFEIQPVSPTQISIRAIMLIDPQLDSIPESLINWGTKQFAEFMVNKMLKLSANFKGTVYEERLKSTESAEFYQWILTYIQEYCDEKGWNYEVPKF